MPTHHPSTIQQSFEHGYQVGHSTAGDWAAVFGPFIAAVIFVMIGLTIARVLWIALCWVWRPGRVPLVNSELYSRSHHAAGTPPGEAAPPPARGFLGLR